MKTNIIFDNVKAYDVFKFDVRLGETFVIEIVESENEVKWFSDNDPVLSLNVNSLSATVKATSVGKSEIQLQSQDGIKLKTLYVEVYDMIATSLNISAGTPELK